LEMPGSHDSFCPWKHTYLTAVILLCTYAD
jgi:hypothetical protein